MVDCGYLKTIPATVYEDKGTEVGIKKTGWKYANPKYNKTFREKQKGLGLVRFGIRPWIKADELEEAEKLVRDILRPFELRAKAISGAHKESLRAKKAIGKKKVRRRNGPNKIQRNPPSNFTDTG